MSQDPKEEWGQQDDEERQDDVPFIRNDKKTQGLHKILDGLFFGPERFDVKKFASVFVYENRRPIFRFIIQYVIPKFYPSEVLYSDTVRDLDRALFGRVKEAIEHINSHDVSLTQVERDWLVDKMNYLISIDRCDVVCMLRSRPNKEGVRGIQIVPRFDLIFHAASKKKSWFKHYSELWGKIQSFHPCLIQQAHDIATVCGNHYYLKKCHPFFLRLRSEKHDEVVDRSLTFEGKYSELVRTEYTHYLKTVNTPSVAADQEPVGAIVKPGKSSTTTHEHANTSSTPAPVVVQPSSVVRPHPHPHQQQPPGFTNPTIASNGADPFYGQASQSTRTEQKQGYDPLSFDHGAFAGKNPVFGSSPLHGNGSFSSFGSHPSPPSNPFAASPGNSHTNGATSPANPTVIDFNMLAHMYTFVQQMQQMQQQQQGTR